MSPGDPAPVASVSPEAQNKEVVRLFYEHLDQREIDAVLDLCAEDFRWGGSTLLWDPERMLGSRGAGVPWRAKEEFRGYLERPNRMPYEHGRLRFRVHGLIAEGDRVAAEVECHGVLPTPPAYNNWFHQVFVIRDGLVRSVSGYKDSLHEYEVLAPFGKYATGDGGAAGR